MSIIVNIKKLYPEISIPKQMDPGSSGFDLYSREEIPLEPQQTQLIKLGFSLEIPFGYEAQIRSRSGLALRNQVIVLNSPGTIDSSFRGEVGVILRNLGKHFFHIKKGDRIAQMVFCAIPSVYFQEVPFLSQTERGTGGFGSTG